jgi:hypothetical protein
MRTRFEARSWSVRISEGIPTVGCLVSTTARSVRMVDYTETSEGRLSIARLPSWKTLLGPCCLFHCFISVSTQLYHRIQALWCSLQAQCHPYRLRGAEGHTSGMAASSQKLYYSFLASGDVLSAGHNAPLLLQIYAGAICRTQYHSESFLKP